MGTPEIERLIVVSPFNKKIMIVSNSISGGGAEISMMRLFDGMRQLKVAVAVCAINDDGITTAPINGVKVIGRKWGAGVISTIKSFQDFRVQLRAFDPEILIVNCELPELYVALSAPVRMKIVAVEHTSRPWNGRRKLGRFIRLILKMRKTKWVTVSRDQKSIWPTSCAARFIPNSHSLGKTRNNTIEADIVFVGRLNNGKHPEIVAEASRLTKSSAAFFGTGPNLQELRNHYHDTEIEFLGFVDSPWSYISPNSIIVVSSEYEGDGMTIVEAVANNNPILLANNLDLKRFNFPEKNYFDSIEELVSKIIEVKNTGPDQFRIHSTTRSRIVEERDPIRVTKIWLETLESEFQA